MLHSACVAKPARRKPSVPDVIDFMAAVRFANGRRDIYRVRGVLDADEARDTILIRLANVSALVVTPCVR
jgi:hypothetical protein